MDEEEICQLMQDFATGMINVYEFNNGGASDEGMYESWRDYYGERVFTEFNTILEEIDP